MYAIIKTGGKQYTVTPGDLIEVEKIDAQPGSKVELQTLFLNNNGKIVNEADKLDKIKVLAEVVEHIKSRKKIVFKFKKRKGYKRKKGHRQQLTRLCVVEVDGVKAARPAKAASKASAPKKDVSATAAATSAKTAKAADKKPAGASKAAKATDKKPATTSKAAKAADKKPATTSKAAKATTSAKTAKTADKKPATASKTKKQAASAAKSESDLSKMTVAQLRALAKERGIKLASGARKAEIIETIKKA